MKLRKVVLQLSPEELFRSMRIMTDQDNDEAHAKDLMEWLKELVNGTFENRKNIQPDYERGTTLRALDVFKLILRTNCRRCGEPSCLAFSDKLTAREMEITKCTPLFSTEYEEKRQVLLELLHAAGCDVADAFLDSERG